MTQPFSMRDAGAQAALASFRGGRLPHAILIEGPAGCGKSRFARLFAMSILCRNPQEAPCGHCPACKKVAAGSHPDLLIYEGEKGKAKSFHIDLVRQLRAQAYVAPNEGERKVLLLEDVQNMTEQAQNALLKVLEEPPASTVFLLTCQSRGQLLETILSRVSVIALSLPAVETCADILAEHLPEYSREELLAAARDASGSPGVALEALRQDSKAHGHRECARRVLELLGKGQEAAALARLQPYEKDRQGMMALLEAMAAQVTNLLLEEEKKAGFSHLQLVKITAIIERITAAAYSNVGGLLLGSALCAGISQVMSETSGGKTS
ncbi:MAG TPA: DNA polymerase III subunit delta' [Clostridiales bacterium]|nr:DNA polymerase III subunit delta' [Clostridiales bacterium]